MTTGWNHRVARRVGAIAATLLVSSAGLTATLTRAASASPAAGAGYSWGENNKRQLGDGFLVGNSVADPTPPLGLGTGVTKLVAYSSGTFALKGGAWHVWGYGSNGELCNGTTAFTAAAPTSTLIPGTATVSGGGSHEVFVDGGAAYQCGDIAGVGVVTSPVAVPGLSSNVVGVEGGNVHSLALMSDGTVRAWGLNYGGQLGDGTTTDSTTPVTVSGLSGVQALAAGTVDNLALKTDGTVVAWGNNALGEVGDGTTDERDTPVPVPGLSNVVAIDAGSYYSVALEADGTVWTWGGNFAAALGNGTTTDAHTPQQVTGLPFISQIAAGDNHVVALSNTGAIYTWGSNGAQQLGSSSSASEHRSPGLVTGVTATQVVAGSAHTAALLPDGSVLSWGNNVENEIGTGATQASAYRSSPGPIVAPGDAGLVAIDGGTDHALALNASGGVLAWGDNDYGALGTGNTKSSGTPLAVTGVGSGVRDIEASAYRSYAVKNDGSVLAWGANFSGSLGDGTTTNQLTPEPISVGGPVVDLAAGNGQTVVAMADGTVRAWGRNDYGDIGNGTTNDALLPITVPGLANVVAVGAGQEDSYAVTTDGKVYAWGANYWGQLGNGATTDDPTPTPQQVTGLDGVDIVAVDSHGSTAAAIDADGNVWTWGYGGSGALGDGTTPDFRSVPAEVSLPSAAASVAVGGSHMLALLDDGSLYAWGEGAQGAVGNGSLSPTFVTSPLHITGVSDVTAIGAGQSFSYAISGHATPPAAGSVSVADAHVTEGNSGTRAMTFAVTLSEAATVPVAVSYTTSNGTAVAPTDYVATSGTVTIPAGATTASVPVTIKGDTTPELSETLGLSLTGVNPSTVTIARATATGTITNDENVAAVSVQDAQVSEGDSGTATLTVPVTLDRAAPATIKLGYTTANGTAVEPGDYIAKSGSVTVKAGASSAAITLKVEGDAVVEPNEGFSVELTGVASGPAVINRAVATATIVNDDSVVHLSIADAQITEGNSGSAKISFTVTLDRPTVAAIKVPYATANGTAVSPGDYTAKSGTLSIKKGASSGVITIVVKGDKTAEANETFSVHLSGVTTTGSASIVRATGVGTILDND